MPSFVVPSNSGLRFSLSSMDDSDINSWFGNGDDLVAFSFPASPTMTSNREKFLAKSENSCLISLSSFFSLLFSDKGETKSRCRFFNIEGVQVKVLAALFRTASGLLSLDGESHNLNGVRQFIEDIINWRIPRGLYSCCISVPDCIRSQLKNGTSKLGNRGGS
nr:hypothetical protein Itr_chr01CG06960 [Ipomoea trifida]GMD88342.1 hypothetical protein Iba_scaffold1606146CG0010 [Ipomoea batatas]